MFLFLFSARAGPAVAPGLHWGLAVPRLWPLEAPDSGLGVSRVWVKLAAQVSHAA